jgi:hypothetical protein
MIFIKQYCSLHKSATHFVLQLWFCLWYIKQYHSLNPHHLLMFSPLYYSAHDSSNTTVNWTHISYHQLNTSQVIILMSTQFYSWLSGPLKSKLCAHCILHTQDLSGNSLLWMFLNDDFSEHLVSSASHCVSTIVDFQCNYLSNTTNWT